ncbi:MAG: DUF58 domain-containing protein [Planctomycetota bacterium]
MLPDELIAKVRRLEILTRRSVSEVFSGDYSSAFRGRGMEFDEVRKYQPGDDVRSIDWNVTARTGEPFVKRFVEERELTVMLAVDLSASGTFGSLVRRKNETAAELCGVLAFVAARNNDKVGLTIFTDEVELFVPPRKGRSHVLRIIREVLEFSPRGTGTRLTAATDHLSRVLKRRAVVFFMSDFLTDEPFERSMSVLAQKHDVVALTIEDPAERRLPSLALLDLVDAETGQRIVFDAGSPVLRRRHAHRAAARREQLETHFRRTGVDHARIETGSDYTHELTELFRTREARR